MKKTAIATLVASCFMAAAIPAQAQTVSDNEIRIGVLTDLSGIYSAIEGPGAVLAAQMAAKDFGGQVLGKKIVITSADTQSKADLSGSKAREMFEKDKVDMIVGNVSTASALAAMEVAEQFKKVSIVTGAASLPITNDQAQSSKAEVIGLANAGGDTIGSVKQAAELGIMGSKQTVVPLLMFISDIQALGLKTTQGMNFTVGWYWDFNDSNRKFAQRFMKEFKGKAPTSVQAGVYSSTMQYLKAVEVTKTDNADAVIKQMKSVEINDGLFKGRIRADGKFEHDMYLLEVKKPGDSKGPNDVAKVVKVIAAKDATLPLAQSKCKYVTK